MRRTEEAPYHCGHPCKRRGRNFAGYWVRSLYAVSCDSLLCGRVKTVRANNDLWRYGTRDREILLALLIDSARIGLEHQPIWEVETDPVLAALLFLIPGSENAKNPAPPP